MNGAPADHVTRQFLAANTSFVVRCPSERTKDLVESLFGDLPSGPGRGAGTLELRIYADEASGRYSLDLTTRIVPPQSLDGVLTSLSTGVSRLALDGEPDRLHLHCAGLSLGEAGLLLVAPSGTGKSTLSAALVLDGWAYLSDEAGSIGRNGPSVAGFAKPLHLKEGAPDLLPSLADKRVADDPAHEKWHVPVGPIPAPTITGLHPTLIVFLHRSADGTTDAVANPEPIHPADAVVGLMEQTMDPARFGRDAVVVLARLAAQVTSVTLTVGPLASSVQAIGELCRSPTSVVAVQPVEGHVASDRGWSVAPQVCSVSIGGRVVVHDTENGAIAALDEAGSAAWLALYDLAPSWWPADSMAAPGTAAFFEQLAEYGLLEPAAGAATRQEYRER